MAVAFSRAWILVSAIKSFILLNSLANEHVHYETTSLTVNLSNGRAISPHFFGIFFEEINHAGAGGLWAELVSNRGFEAGGHVVPSMMSPWGMIGDESDITITTELSSCFQTNPVALRMDVHCDPSTCPRGGVGVYNPGYWGMNIEEGKSYNVVFYIKSSGPLDAVLSLVHEDQVFAFQRIMADAMKVKEWTKMEVTLQAKGSHPRCRLQFTTWQKGIIWIDQVSSMPSNTYKGHGFRADLMEMLMKLEPRFLRFPGGCYVEGDTLKNAFRWKTTVGPWEERRGHYNDIWFYWSDDGLGYLEYLQLAEDLGAEPVWVVNNGIGHKDQVATNLLAPFVQEMLDSIEFARGSPNSTWGSLRAKLGHPTPFSLKYVAIGNEDCSFIEYQGNYMRFYKAIKETYPDIEVISNCDATKNPLNHPADLYDYHNYTTVEGMLQLTRLFEKRRRDDPNAPKAFVSEYAVKYPDKKVHDGICEGALAEAAFLLSLEQNSDVVQMVSYAPLFANQQDQYRWRPDAIFFNSNEVYGKASFWVQTFFTHSSGGELLNIQYHNNSEGENIYLTAIRWSHQQEKKHYLTIKVVNFNNVASKLKISFDGVDQDSMELWQQTVLSCEDLLADNTFDNPTEVMPVSSSLKGKVGKEIDVMVKPYTFTAFDLIILS